VGDWEIGRGGGLGRLGRGGELGGNLGLAEKVKKRKKCGLGKYGLKKHR
jgi:hypothetical protein